MSRASSAIRILPARGTRALLAIDGPASATFDTVIEAQAAYEGPAGNLITLAMAATGAWVPNVGTLTLVENPSADETVTIGDTVYTWKAIPDAAFEVDIGADASGSLDNLIAAINLNGTAGTTYGAATTIHPTVRAFAGDGDTMVVQTKSDSTLSAVGTLIATTDGMGNAGNVWGAATLADGTDGVNVEFAVDGTAISCVFSGGYTTVADFEAAIEADADVSALIAVETPGTTPLYQLVVTDDDFSATALAGGGASSASAPTLTDGSLGVARPFYADEAACLVRSTGGTGTMTITPVIWGWNPGTSHWYVVKKPNGGSAIAETSNDGINYSETLTGLGPYSKFYCQVAASSGVEAEVYLDFVAPGSHD